MNRAVVVALAAAVPGGFGGPAAADKKSPAPTTTPGDPCTNSYSLCLKDCYVVKGTGTDEAATSCNKTCYTLYHRCKASPRTSSPARVKPQDAPKTVAPTR